MVSPVRKEEEQADLL